MKKSELIKRIELLESRQAHILKDTFRKGTGAVFSRFYNFEQIHTHTKIKKILEYLGIEIYETASEIKVRSAYKPKKKKEKK